MPAPDVNSREKLETWLKKQSWEVSTAISARAALRSVPSFVGFANWKLAKGSKAESAIILPSLRAMALPLVATRHPARINELNANSAGNAAASGSNRVGIPHAHAAAHAASRASYATDADDSSSAAPYAADAVAYAAASHANFAGFSYGANAFEAAANLADVDFGTFPAASNAVAFAAAVTGWRNAQWDCDRVAEGVLPSPLTLLPLWGLSLPGEVLVSWRELEHELHALNQSWQVWTKWYDAILSGRPTPGGEELDLFRVLLNSEDDWSKGAAHVNALIKAKEEEIAGRGGREQDDTFQATGILGQPPTALDEKQLASQPASVETELVNNVVVLRPEIPQADLARDILGPAAQDLADALADASADALSENADRRAIAMFGEARDAIARAITDQQALFKAGRLLAAFEAYSATVNSEWGGLASARYKAMLLQYQETIDKFPSWRAFKRKPHPRPEGLTVARLAALADKAIDEFQNEIAIISRPVLDRLRALLADLNSRTQTWADINNAVETSTDMLMADIAESLSNVGKSVAKYVYRQVVVPLLVGAHEELPVSANKLGKRIVALLLSSPVLLAIAGYYLDAFSWFQPLRELLEQVSTK